jgi:hypothetical protein
MANCASDLQELDPSCFALKKKGGLKKRVWIGGFDIITPTVDGDGYVDTITLDATVSPANKLYEYIGKKLKHNGAIEGEVGENTNVLTQNLNLVLYYYSPAERESIEKLFNSEEVMVFVETEAGLIEVWGFDTGLMTSALTGSTGTALNDSTAITITLSGQQDNLPKVLKIGANDPDVAAQLAAYTAENVAYLVALT